MKTFIGRMIETVETSPFSLPGFALSFLAIILVRLFIETGVNAYKAESHTFLFYEFSHTFLFFLFSFTLFLPVMRFAGAASWSRAANLLLFGFLIIWTPPLIDAWIFQGAQFWSFYELDGLRGLFHRFLTFFGDTPNIGITYGARIEIALMSIGIGYYAFFRSKKLLRTLGAALLAYTVFFILGTFPSWVTIFALAPTHKLFSVSELDVVGYMLTPGKILDHSIGDMRGTLNVKMSLVYAVLTVLSVGTTLLLISKKTFLSLLRNVRFPQTIWHGGLLFLGGALAIIFSQARPEFDFFGILSVLVLVAAVESAWIASVIGNDLSDIRIDEKTNTDRPLPTHTIERELYATIGVLFFFISILFAAIVSFKCLLFLLAYQALAWAYSMPPLRLKRIPILATVLAALAGMTVLLTGYFAITTGSDIQPVPLSILFFLFIAYAVTLPLKDFKDIAGDKADGVMTIPVLLGTERARIVIGSALFLIYAISPVVLREARLLVPAILFGSLAFWSVVRAERSKKRWGNFRTLPAWNMVFIILYGIIAGLTLV